jgi:hypothetical protein
VLAKCLKINHTGVKNRLPTPIQGTRSQKGLENHSVLRSLFETAKRQGKKVHLFFHDLFTNNTVQAQAALYRNPLLANPAASKTASRLKPP